MGGARRGAGCGKEASGRGRNRALGGMGALEREKGGWRSGGLY